MQQLLRHRYYRRNGSQSWGSTSPWTNCFPTFNQYEWAAGQTYPRTQMFPWQCRISEQVLYNHSVSYPAVCKSHVDSFEILGIKPDGTTKQITWKLSNDRNSLETAILHDAWYSQAYFDKWIADGNVVSDWKIPIAARDASNQPYAGDLQIDMGSSRFQSIRQPDGTEISFRLGFFGYCKGGEWLYSFDEEEFPNPPTKRFYSDGGALLFQSIAQEWLGTTDRLLNPYPNPELIVRSKARSKGLNWARNE